MSSFNSAPAINNGNTIPYNTSSNPPIPNNTIRAAAPPQSQIGLSSPAPPGSKNFRAQLRRIAVIPASYNIPDIIPLNGKDLAIGRSLDCDVVLDSKIFPGMISRHHCKLIATTNGYTLLDQESKNGITLNDKRISREELADGDIIIFGGASAVKMNSFLRQPRSEFIYKYEILNNPSSMDSKKNKNNNSSVNPSNSNESTDDEGDESAFEILKSITENFQVIATWLTSLILCGNYLFADEGSEEFSYINIYVHPVFSALGIPFTRINFLFAFVIIMCLLVFIIYQLSVKKKKNKKAKTR